MILKKGINTMNENFYNLDHQLERSVEWVKYAETKNAVALGLLGAAFIDVCKMEIWASLCGKVLIITLGIQLILLVCSFIPRFSSPLCLKQNKAELNFHYYGDISSVSLDEFRSKLKESYPELEHASKHFKDVTHQIHINCEIAMAKFKFFKGVCYLMFVSGLSFILKTLFGL